MRTLFFTLLFHVSFCFAQTSFSLADCQEMARQNSPAAKIASLTRKAEAFDYQAFLAGFKPQVSLNGNLPGLRRSIDNIIQDDGSIRFVPQSQTFSTLSIDARQAIPLTGGEILLSSSLFNRNDLSGPSDPLWQSSIFVFQINQPLFDINRFRWDREQQDVSLKLSRVDYIASLESASRRATELYFDVLIAQTQREIARVNVANNDTIFQISRGRFSVGKIAENELLQSELSLMNARTQFETAEINYKNAIRRLAIVLGLDKENTFSLRSPGPVPVINAEPNAAVQKALATGRLRIAADQQRVRAERALAEAKANNRPSANLNAAVGLNQTATSLEGAYSNPVDRQNFSIGLNMPILQWGAGRDREDAAKARLEAAEIAIEQSFAEYEAEVAYQISNLQLLKQQLIRSERGDTIAQRRFEVAKQRYLVGKIDLQSLFIAQNEKDQARRAWLSTLQSYWLALARLREQTLYDFVKEEEITQ